MTLKISSLRTFSLLVLMLAFGATFAFGKHDHAGRGIDRMVAKMEKELNLTKDQSTKIRAILSEDTAGMGEMRAMHREHGGMAPMGGMGMMGGPEFAKQLRADKVDTEALNKGFEERQTQMREMHAKHLAKFVAIHDVLTPEQRAKAADEMEKRAAKMEKHSKDQCERNDKECH